ncbi:MAG TPA: molybdopterin-dependent oxidoreductase [Chloroflexota bacterium]|nr:molybdopterin-dependent oxidoreductase [Chloroflexota bacterium]
MESRETHDLTRRGLLVEGATAAGLALLPSLHSPSVVRAYPSRPGEEVLPWLDQPAPNPVPHVAGGLLRWEDLTSLITPVEQFFTIAHYGQPEVDVTAWRLEVGGLVENPLSLTLEELRARPRQEVVFTMECSGNHGLPFLHGAIGTARWRGTPLAPLLAEAGVLTEGSEVVFWGADAGEEEIREIKVPQHFARSMSVADATDPTVLLCYEMNRQPLPPKHGAPLRLIAPGWYGVANVKWLTRIEVRESRLQNRFMARDYVTLRQEPPGAPPAHAGEPVWVETSVGKALLKSAPARVTRAGGAGSPAGGQDRQYRVIGAAWGAPIARVEVRIDDGPWLPTRIDHSTAESEEEFVWRLWYFDWNMPTPSEHAITSRAIATDGRVQPAPDDPWLAGKQTYWESNGQITRRVAISAD